VTTGVLYASTNISGNPEHVDADTYLNSAIESLLHSVGEEAMPEVLWKVEYTHHVYSGGEGSAAIATEAGRRTIVLPSLSTDLVLDDVVLGGVKAVWREITGETGETFMKFEAREGVDDEE
jgi:Rab proteins geranylgeranyltransferase component A